MDKPNETPETIYLIPDYDEGILGHVWCDDPAPGLGMDPEDAIEYRRADVADTALAAAEARIAELEKALEPFAREEVSGMYKDAWHLQFSDPEGFVDFTDFTIGDLRRAAALLKEKE